MEVLMGVAVLAGYLLVAYVVSKVFPSLEDDALLWLPAVAILAWIWILFLLADVAMFSARQVRRLGRSMTAVGG